MRRCGNCYYSLKQLNIKSGYVLCDLKHCKIREGSCCDDWREDIDEEL